MRPSAGNKGSAQKILPAVRFIKNFVVLLVSNVISRISTFLLFILCAQYLGPEDFGYFLFINASTSVLFMVLDFGINFYAVKEVSTNRPSADIFFSNAIAIKGCLGILGSLGLVGACFAFGVSERLIGPFVLGGIALFIDSLNKLFFAIFIAFEKAKFEAVAVTLERAMALALGFGALYFGFGLLGVFAGYALARLTSFIYLLTMYCANICKPAFRIELSRIRALLKAALPYAMNVMLGMVAFRIDIFMLKLYVASEQIGFYGAAITLFAALMVVAEIYRQVVYPVLSRQFQANQDKVNDTVNKSIDLLILFVLPITILGYFHADLIIRLVYGVKYSSSALVLRYIVLALPSVYLSQLLGITLTSIDRQKIRPLISSIGILLNVILNFLLIPKYGMLGAAIATIIASVGILFVFAYFVSRYGHRFVLSKSLVISACGAIAMVLLLKQSHIMGAWVATALSLLTYTILQLASGTWKQLRIALINDSSKLDGTAN